MAAGLRVAHQSQHNKVNNMKWNRLVSTALAAACMALVAGCGGGGGSDDETQETVAVDYSLRAGYTNFLSSPGTGDLNATAVVRGTGTCVGAGALVNLMSAGTTFAGAASVRWPQTLWLTLRSCEGTPLDPAASLSASQNVYRDATGAILGIDDEEFTSIARAPIVLPERIRVGDTAVLGTLDTFATAGGAIVGTTVVRYAAKADRGRSNSVLVEITYVGTGPAQEAVQQELQTYRLGTDGSMQMIRYDITSQEASISLVAPS